MTVDDVVGALIALALVGFFVAAMLFPERF